MSPQRQKIEWEPNIPITVTLEFDGGKEVPGRSGPQYLYWVDGQRSMFMDPRPHELIQATGARQGDTLEITKTLQGRKVDWEVVHVVDEPAPQPIYQPPTQPVRRTQPAATAPSQAERDGQPRTASHPQPITPATCNMLSALCSAIDALTEAAVYAKRKGLTLNIDAEMVRRTATTIYIGRGEACNQ